MQEIWLHLIYEYGPAFLQAHRQEKYPFVPTTGMLLMIAGVIFEIVEVTYVVDEERFAVYLQPKAGVPWSDAFRPGGGKPSVKELADMLEDEDFDVEVHDSKDFQPQPTKPSKKHAA